MTKAIFPILRMAAFAAIAMCLPHAAQAAPETFFPCPPAHLCPGFTNGWGGAAFSQATLAGGYTACDSNHACQITLQGTATAQTFFGAAGEIGELQPTVVTETFDFSHPAPNGAGGSCYPAVGNLSITDTTDPNSTLVIAFQGQGCQIGTDQTQLLVTATYVIDGASTGRYKGVAGIGSVNLLSPTSLSVTPPQTQLFPYSFAGNLRFPGPGQKFTAAANSHKRSILAAMLVPASGLGSVGLGLFAFVWAVRRPRQRKAR